MAVGADGGGFNLLGWIAGGCVVVGAGIGGLYYAGLLAPDSEPVPNAPVETVALPQTPTAPKPVQQDTATVADTVTAPTAAPTAATPEPVSQDTTAATRAPEPKDTAAVTPDPAPESHDTATATPEPQLQAEAALPDLPTPRFDLVRVDPDGNAVIAGTGPAGSRVKVFLDDAEQDSTVADAGGAFVSLVSIPPSTTPRVLTLVAYLSGRSVASEDQIILAPTMQSTPQIASNATVETTVETTAETTAESAPEPSAQLAATESAPETQLALAETTQAPTPTPAPTAVPATSPALVDDTAALQPPADTAPAPTATNTADPVADPSQDAKPVASAEPTTSDPAGQPSSELASEPGAVTRTQTTQETASVDPVVTPNADLQTATTELATDPVPQPVPQTEAGATSDPGSVLAETAKTTETPQVPAPVVTATAPQKPGPVAILRAGADGVEVLQPSTLVPELLDKIALDAISYSKEGKVQLSGRAQGHSVVRIYLDNTAVADMTTDDRGNWSGKIDGIKPGIYTLRLDELDAGGAVLSRLETPFKRESPEALRPPQDSQGGALAETPLIRAVTVQTGDTLWAISRERYGDGVLYVRVFEANRNSIRDPDLIYPGQVFAIPE